VIFLKITVRNRFTIPKDIVCYEFSTDEPIFEDGNEFDLFRLELHPDGDNGILAADLDSYFVSNDVTHHFDIFQVIHQCFISQVDDVTNDWLDWANENKEWL
jgi:hypothetical protein